MDSAKRYHVNVHVISYCHVGEKTTHIFLSLLYTGRDLGLGSKCFVLGRVDLVLSEHRKGGFDAQLLDPNLSGRHGVQGGG